MHNAQHSQNGLKQTNMVSNRNDKNRHNFYDSTIGWQWNDNDSLVYVAL